MGTGELLMQADELEEMRAPMSYSRRKASREQLARTKRVDSLLEKQAYMLACIRAPTVHASV